MRDWRETLAELETYDFDGWYWQDNKSWGVAIDQTALRAARDLAERLHSFYPAKPPIVSGDPIDGTVALHWYREDRALLTAYAEPDGTYALLALGLTGPFTIDRDELPVREAVEIIGAWLLGSDQTWL
jgi:hypothetical protein